MKTLSLLIIIIALPAYAHDTKDIETAIYNLTTGVDRQDKKMLLAAFSEDASLFATNPAGDALISVSAAQFAEMHAQKRFGGQPREISINYIDVTEGISANATVIASNDNVHYTYYLGLFKADGEWRIQTFLQRSRPANSD